MGRRCKSKYLLATCSVVLLTACTLLPTDIPSQVTATAQISIATEDKHALLVESATHAKYIFLFIGDGMGVAQRSAAELYIAATTDIASRPEETTLLMNELPVQGLTTTYSLTSVIPDSAAAGTALATGNKTHSGVVSMGPDGTTIYPTIAEIAKSNGWRIGIVTTVSLDHATPAVFYAHQSNRNNYYEIGNALVTSEFDYFAGGPLKRPTGYDPENPSPDLYQLAEDNGFTVAVGRQAFDTLQPGVGRVLILPDYEFSGDSLYYTIDDVPENDLSIVDLTQKGIKLLDNPNGFFFMIEAGKIDWACHANDAATAIHETIALDQALQLAYSFYEQHPDETLIVVTGDHETGGMAIGFAGTKYATSFEILQYQTISFTSFNTIVAAWRREGDTQLDEIWPVVEANFGLLSRTTDEITLLEQAAEFGDKPAQSQLDMVLSDLELQILSQAFIESMLPPDERANNYATWLLYGGYEPLVVKLTTILNQKAGIAWTTYSHTGIPVQTSAIGVGAEQFNGYYDQTDIFKFMIQAADLTVNE